MKKHLIWLMLGSMLMVSCNSSEVVTTLQVETTSNITTSMIIPTTTSSMTKPTISTTVSSINNQIVRDMTEYIDSLILNTPSYIPAWNKESFKGRWNYIDGVFLNSIVKLYYSIQTTDKDKANFYKSFFINYINYYIDSNGNFINPQTREPYFQYGELDSICESKILFDAYDMTGDTRYLKAIESSYVYLQDISLVQGSYGNYNHKQTYPNQIWLDGMYMYAPFNARYAKYKNMTDEFHKIRRQYQFIRERMYDENSGLYYHGYSSTGIFWSGYEEGTSSSFWLRSLGWFVTSLTDVIEYFPNGDDKEYLIDLLNEALTGVLDYQDDNTKMFYQLIDKKEYSVVVPSYYLAGLNNTDYLTNDGYKDTLISNYLESSGSSMIAYAMMKSAKLGYIDSDRINSGREIFEGIYKHSFINNSLNDICITAGLGPEGNYVRDGSAYYYLAEKVGSDDAKGVGPFIMAYLEYQE